MADVDSWCDGINPRPDVSRRTFVKSSLAATAWTVARDQPAALRAARAESPIDRFFHSLDDDQRRRIGFPFEHPLRTRVQNNWAIVPSAIRDLTREQQAHCRAIFKAVCRDDAHDRFLRQMRDDGGGFENYHVALFGTTGTLQPLEWVLTGRHLTLRAVGGPPDRVCASGPLFFGHGAELSSSIWRPLVEHADAVVNALVPSQLVRAFSTASGTAVERGLAIETLALGQKRLVQRLLSELFRPFHHADADVVQTCLEEPSAADRLRLSFFPSDAGLYIGRTWDAWRLEGPGFAWSFQSVPHVHSWVHFTSPSGEPN